MKFYNGSHCILKGGIWYFICCLLSIWLKNELIFCFKTLYSYLWKPLMQLLIFIHTLKTSNNICSIWLGTYTKSTILEPGISKYSKITTMCQFYKMNSNIQSFIKKKVFFLKTKNLRFKHDYHTSVNFFYVKLWRITLLFRLDYCEIVSVPFAHGQ